VVLRSCRTKKEERFCFTCHTVVRHNNNNDRRSGRSCDHFGGIGLCPWPPHPLCCLCACLPLGGVRSLQKTQGTRSYSHVLCSLEPPRQIVICLLIIILQQYAGLNLPPQSSGLVPFVGAGISFASGPLQYATKVYEEVI